MAMVDSVDVPAHGSISFAPGGYHLMCVRPADRVKPGNTVEMTLTFDDGGALTVDFRVRNAKGE
jgi:copper(I)-binding protein